MDNLAFVDLRIIYYPSVQIEFLGSGKLENKDLIQLAIQLEETITKSELDETAKNNLLHTTVQEFINTVKVVSKQLVNEEMVKNEVQRVKNMQQPLSPLMELKFIRKQMLEEYKNTGQCKCPHCGFKLISVDGEIRCLNCGFNCGIIE